MLNLDPIKSFLKVHRITNKYVAESLGYSPVHISRALGGKSTASRSFWLSLYHLLEPYEGFTNIKPLLEELCSF